MEDKKPVVYEGSKPYIFISMSHGANSKELNDPLIARLYARGYRLWFEAGVPANADMNIVKDKIKGSKLCLFLITKEWVRTSHCDQEIAYAKEKGCNTVPIFMEEVRLTPKLRDYFEGQAGFTKDEWPREEFFYDELFNFPYMEDCREPRVREIYVEKVMAKLEVPEKKKGNKLFKKLKSLWS